LVLATKAPGVATDETLLEEMLATIPVQDVEPIVRIRWCELHDVAL
jgi:hypothetical protein